MKICTPVWMRSSALLALGAVASFAIEYNDIVARIQQHDLSIAANEAMVRYQSKLTQTESRWGNTEFALGTVNLGVKEWELTASQGLELGDRPQKRMAITKAEMQVTDAEKGLRKAEVALLVGLEFHAIQLAERSTAVLDSQIQKTRKLLEWQGKMVANGSMDPLDTLRTGVILETLQQEKENWGQSRKASIRNLSLMTDTSFSENEVFQKEWPTPTPSYQVIAQAENPRLQISIKAISITDAEMELQKAATKPELGFNAGIAGGESYDALLGVSVSIPLFTGNAAKVIAVQEKRTASQATHVAKVKEEKANAQRLRNNLEALAAEYGRIANKLIPLEQQVLDISKQRYYQGTLPHSQFWEQSEAVNRLELRKLEVHAQFADVVAELTLFPEVK